MQTLASNREKAINKHLDTFDPLALLRVLKHQGYKENTIWFCSHNSLVSQKRLIEKVTLKPGYALISVNLGLLSPLGELPTYLRKFMERGDVNTEAFSAFIRFFDHVMVSQFIKQLYPQINRDFFDCWKRTKNAYVALQNMCSDTALIWLFQTAYPEFIVTLKHDTALHTYNAHALTLGHSSLGNGNTFGAVGKTQALAPHMILNARWQAEPLGRSWLSEAKWRLERLIFPYLHQLDLSITIDLYLGNSLNALQLDSDSELGSDRFQHYDPAPNFTRLHTGSVFINKHTNASNEVNWEDVCRMKV